jgi:hypothetical protein
MQATKAMNPTAAKSLPPLHKTGSFLVSRKGNPGLWRPRGGENPSRSLAVDSSQAGRWYMI